jgi:hypothetical protein
MVTTEKLQEKPMSNRGQSGMYNQRRVAEAQVVPGTRIPPPPELNELESAIWRAIVERLPADWFTAENTPLLKELCRHIGHADALSLDIAAVRAVLAGLPASGLAPSEAAKEFKRATADYHALLRLHAFQTERIGNLSTKMRLSQQTRLAPAVSRAKADQTPAGPKPWQDWDALPEVVKQ